MNSPVQPYSYKSPALYNPRLWNPNEVRAYYVARPALLDRIVDDLKREDANNHPQHRLIVGLRGMGKSTLLRRIAVAIEDDAQLNASWLPLSFPEEQYNVATLSDFWLNCLDALSDLLESHGQADASAKLDAEVELLDRKDGEGALGALLRAAGTLQRRLLLLVDNIDLIFERIKAEDWRLREALQAHPEILIVGASAKVLEDSYNYQAAFYDFFKIDELRGLSEAEMRDTIVNLARLNKADQIIERVDADPARLRVLHTLTGGNPRTAVLLYGVLLKGIDGDVRSDLEGLLDEVTPLYKARFEELPPQSQQLLDKLALHWHPASAAVLTKQLGWKVNLVSAQLDRLIGAGIVEKVKAPKSKRLNFQIGERFFNIWYLMRTSRRLRRRLIWLVECLRGLYSSEELQAIARARIAHTPDNIRNAETLIALSDAIDEKTYKRALTDRALELFQTGASRKLIAELFDFEGEDKDIKQRHELLKVKDYVNRTLYRLTAEQTNNDMRNYFETSVLTPSEYHELEKMLDASMNVPTPTPILTFLRKSSALSIAAFGVHAAPLVARATQSSSITELNDQEGWDALALRECQPYFSRLCRAIRSTGQMLRDGDRSQPAIIEQDCEALINFDDTGCVPWSILVIALTLQNKFEEAKQAIRRVLSLETAPVAFALSHLRLLIAFHDQDWPMFAPSLVQRIDLSDNEQIQELVQLSLMANQRKESGRLLSVLDSTMPNGELLPFREALNAAAHNDASLLELLAPEVQEPARQFLAVIAPKLLQQSVT